MDSVSLDNIVKQQLEQIAQTLTSKFEQSKQELRQIHRKELAELQSQVRHLQHDLKASEESCTIQKQNNDHLQKLVVHRNIQLSHAYYKWKFVGRRVFLSWKRLTHLRKEKRKMARDRFHSRKNGIVSACFMHWKDAARCNKSSRMERVYQEKFKVILKEVISQYEQEIRHLQQKLNEAQMEVTRGIVQRQELEEKVRGLLMKGMMAMNMDTLLLFSREEDDYSSPASAAAGSGGGGNGGRGGIVGEHKTSRSGGIGIGNSASRGASLTPHRLGVYSNYGHGSEQVGTATGRGRQNYD